MPKINILYVITKLELGGAQKQLLSLINSLDRQRFRVFLFTSEKGLLMPEALSIEGLSVKRSGVLERPVHPFKDFFSLIEIYCYIKENEIHLVHTHSSKAGILGRLAAALAGVKMIVHTVHGWSFNEYQNAFARRFFITLEQICAPLTRKLIVVCEHDRTKGLCAGIGRDRQYQLIPYGIRYEDFLPAEQGSREKLGIREGELVVGMVACLKPQKSPLDFIRLASLSLQRIPKVKFILAGDGGLRGATQALIRELGLEGQVLLLGWRRDIPAFLKVCDIVVLTSRWEGLPIAALEALASSRPVVATDTGGIREVVIEGRNGYLVPVEDMRLMSHRVCTLLEDGVLRKRMGIQAKESLGAEYRHERMVDFTLELYEELLKI